MKSMKSLIVAVAGVMAFGVVGTAFAQCPTGIAQANGGAWSNISLDSKGSTLSIVQNGYDGTNCKLQSSLFNGGAAVAQVRDDSPTGETRYRAQFIFDPTNLSGASGNNQAVIFQANAAASHNGSLPIVKLLFAGTGGGSTTAGKRIFVTGACEGASSCGIPVALPVQQGPNRIEIDVQIGGNGVGTLRYWVNDAATTGLQDNTPTGTVTITGGNSGWVGVETAFMGMSSPSSNYRSVNTNANVWFDEFDSRRQTFIGH